MPSKEESVGNFYFPKVFCHVLIAGTKNMFTARHKEEEPIEVRELVEAKLSIQA